MSEPKPPVTQERNPKTTLIHQKEVLRQITIPLVIGLAIVIPLCLWAISGTDYEVYKRANISVILMIMPLSILGLISLVLLAGMLFAVIRILQLLPPLMYRVHQFFFMVNQRVSRASDAAVEPFLRVHSFTASARALKKQTLRRK